MVTSENDHSLKIKVTIMKTMQLFTLLFILFGASTFLQAQEFDGKASFFAAQFQKMDVDDYNTQALTLGQPELSSNMFGFSLDWMEVEGRWLNSPGFSFFYDLTNHDDNQGSNRLHVFSADYGWGYNLLKPNSKWIVAPEIMVTIQHHQFKTTADDADNLIQAQTVDNFTMSRWDFPVRLGAQIVRTWMDDETNDGFVIRLRGGYQLGDTDRWKYNDAVRTDNGGISTEGFYISLGIGGFNGAKKKNSIEGSKL